jgi:hypothetical protein
MTWHRNEHGLWCACFQTYQPDHDNGCPAHPCPQLGTETLAIEETA